MTSDNVKYGVLLGQPVGFSAGRDPAAGPIGNQGRRARRFVPVSKALSSFHTRKRAFNSTVFLEVILGDICCPVENYLATIITFVPHVEPSSYQVACPLASVKVRLHP
ncbi:hypothetical protein [Novosphingobium sp.]|uniref:hypothetical protein n=1 Tax=Novosphingobium sp. TaxID=1874826 RepID=UPI00286E7A87|nr:hypothetical protein [Novosphingobium sp.]